MSAWRKRVQLATFVTRLLAASHVFQHGGSLFMLYNGNEYGRTGFGLAVLDN